MTYEAVTGMAKNYHGRPRERLSAFLRQMYPGVGRDKRLAADLQISPRAARNLFEDHWPSDDTFAAIVARFGRTVVRIITEPDISPVLAELTEREARLERELEAARLRRREAEGFLEGAADRRAGDAGAPDPAQLTLFETRTFETTGASAHPSA
jgi:hypothetical protein